MKAVSRKYKDIKSELDKILSKLQNDDLDIDQVVELYEKGQELLSEMQKYLSSAENKIKKLKINLKNK